MGYSTANVGGDGPRRVVRSACVSSFSRLAQRSLALRPAHSRRHPFVARFTEGFSLFVASTTATGSSTSPAGLTPAAITSPYHGAHPLRTFVRLQFVGAYDWLKKVAGSEYEQGDCCRTTSAVCK
jgi:hypothetical protein